MGWADMATVVPIAERAALAVIRADSEDPWAHYVPAVMTISLGLEPRHNDDGCGIVAQHLDGLSFECDYRPAGSRARQTNRPSLAKPQICDGHHSAGTDATIELGLPAQLDQRRPQ